jgi:hypothetical protein
LKIVKHWRQLIQKETHDVISGRATTRVVLVVCESHHIFSLVPEILCTKFSYQASSLTTGCELTGEEILDILHVVDAPAKFTSLIEVVDSDEETLLLASTLGILEEGLVVTMVSALEVRAIILDVGRRARRGAAYWMH